MDLFNYKNGELFAEEIAVADIAKSIPTPFYLYSQQTLERHYRIFNEALPIKNKLVCFAVKANSNISFLKILAKLGSGADVVSQGEIIRALKAGIPANKIVFSGVGKTRTEIAFALEKEILQFNCESLEEIKIINEIAANQNKKAPIAIRINPDIDSGTHAKITTGTKENKFGIDIDLAPKVINEISQLKNINFKSLSIHIGSQITTIAPFEKAFTKIIDFAQQLIAKGIKLETIDLGGGLGVPYSDHATVDPSKYGKTVANATATLPDIKYIFEPGRLLAANTGILVSKVIFTKKTPHKNFLIIDAAMNDLLRPSLYEAHHEIFPVNKNTDQTETYDVVGPVCETGDIFAKNLVMPKVNSDDLIIIRSSGAYGAVMASQYNSRPLIAEVLINGDEFSVIRKAPNYEEMLSNEDMAPWL